MQSRPDRESARAKFRAEVDPALQAISASDSARVQLRDSLHSYLKATPPVEQAQEYLAWTPQLQSSSFPVDLLVGDAETLLVVHPVSPPAHYSTLFFFFFLSPLSYPFFLLVFK